MPGGRFPLALFGKPQAERMRIPAAALVACKLPRLDNPYTKPIYVAATAATLATNSNLKRKSESEDSEWPSMRLLELLYKIAMTTLGVCVPVPSITESGHVSERWKNQADINNLILILINATPPGTHVRACRAMCTQSHGVRHDCGETYTHTHQDIQPFHSTTPILISPLKTRTRG